MSPRPGGESDKFGNRYEAAWTVRHVLYVLLGRGSSLIVEDINEFGEGAEFTYRSGVRVEVHQLKRQNGNASSWSVRSLQDKGIWKRAREHAEAGREYHFVSLIPAIVLQNLSDYARRSNDLTTFIDSWLGSKDVSDAFNELCKEDIFGSPSKAWNVLRRFWIEWHDERDIVNTNSAIAEMLLSGSPGQLATAGISDIVVNNLGTRLDSSKIQEELAKYGLRRTEQPRQDSVIAQVATVSTNWSESVERELLRPYIPRTEAEKLIELAESSNNTILLTGTAGGGKTSVLHQSFLTLQGQDTPTLVFRLDRVGRVDSTNELGNQVGLNMSPVAALAVSARDRKCVLIVDQLDAVSLTSGRMISNFDTIAALIREASAFSNMTVVLACRKFDVENDHRIRELVASRKFSQIEVTELADKQITAAIDAMGLASSRLDRTQKNILKTPLNLVLLQSIADEESALTFRTTKSLFDTFWQRKLGNCLRRREGVRFNDVISTVSDAISARQRLSVSITVLDRDDLSLDAEVLISEHVLVRDGQQIAFFHESFFDYAFARGWISQNGTIVGFLTQGEQELFRRAQVRQILSHIREAEPERFVTEVSSVLKDQRIRFHIKDVVLSLIKSLTDPTSAEWEMLSELLAMSLPFESRLARCLHSTEWFDRLDTEGAIENWLDGEEDAASRAIEIIASAAKQRPDRIHEILRRRTQDSSFPAWIRNIARWADLHASRSLFELVLAAVRDNHYDGHEHELWMSTYELADHQPAWALELAHTYLTERPNSFQLDSQGRMATLTDRDHTFIRMIQLAATGAPRRFCDLFLPYIRKVMTVTSYDHAPDLPIKDRHFSHRYPGDNAHEVDDAIRNAAAASIRYVVEHERNNARSLLEPLALEPYEAAQWLLYEGLQVAGQELAQWSIDLLLEGTHRFLSGYASNSVWLARQVILKVSKYASEATFYQLESMILGLRFSWEQRGASWYMFNLLSAMTESRLSETGRRRLGELRRAFNMEQPPAPSGVTVDFVRPPIPRESARKMSDSQWLSAIAKHSSDQTNWHNFTGGARELSHVLKDEAKAAPVRFSRLTLRFTRDTHPAYSDAVLMAFAEADQIPDPTPIFDAVRHVASLGQPSSDRWLGHALRKYLRKTPADIVELLIHTALTSPQPAPGEVGIVTTSRPHARGEDLYSSGINSARGSAAETLGNLLVYDVDGTRTALVIPVLEQLASDSSLAVRTCVAHLIHAAMRHARPAAMESFVRLIDTDDLLLATRTVARLVAYIGYGDAPTVRPVIERMIGSSNFETRVAGGQLAAVAAMQWDLPDMFNDVLASDDAASRQGAADICATALVNASDITFADRGLSQFLNDPRDEVLQAAAKVAITLRDNRLSPFKDLLTTVISSAAFTHALPQLLITLERAPDRVDDLLLQTCRRFIELDDSRSRWSGDAQHVGELLVRAYTQSLSIQRRTAVLDLIDDLLALDLYGIAEAVEAFSR